MTVQKFGEQIILRADAALVFCSRLED